MTPLNRRRFLGHTGAAALGAACGFSRSAAAREPSSRAGTRPPNFVFIFADDLGWGDLGCYGNRRLKTPCLDRLAEQGILFTQFYVSGSVCSPSRAAIMTGQFPARLGIHGHFSIPKNNTKRGMPQYMDPSVMTVTRLLRQSGYVTGMFGKWHLGSGPGAPLPDAYGFDEHRTNTSNDPEAGSTFNLWSTELRPVSAKMVLDEAAGFIETNRARPFFVNAWLVDPHATLNPSAEQMDEYSSFAPKGVEHAGAEQIYYATVTEVDRQIGLFLKKLDALGLAENTVVIFSSDNGPEDIQIHNAAHSGVGSSGPFRGRKRSLYEGGVRVPFIVRYPSGTPAGKVDDTSVIGGVDFLPSICSLAGVPVPADVEIDGEDMSAALLGESTDRTTPLMWEWRYRIFGHTLNKSPMLAIRRGNWKLLMNPDRSRFELYDIPKDPSEMNDLSLQHPDVVRRLSREVLAWQKELPESPLDAVVGSNTYPWPR